jgi:4'-phosphopantetheinyl transferase
LSRGHLGYKFVLVDTVEVWLIDGRKPCPAVESLLELLSPSERERADSCLSERDRREYVIAHAAVRCIVSEQLAIAPALVRWEIGPHGKPHLSGHAQPLEVNLSHSGDLCMVAVSPSRPVGVDVQRLATGPAAAALAQRFFPPEETRLVLDADDNPVAKGTTDVDESGHAGDTTAHADPHADARKDADGDTGTCDPAQPATRPEIFARLWVRKEALVKAVGSRLTMGLAVPTHGPAPLTIRHPRIEQGPVRIDDLNAPHGYSAAIALAGADPFRVVSREWTWPTALLQQGPLNVSPRVPRADPARSQTSN